jgi:D-galactarolactone cycloisomerase
VDIAQPDIGACGGISEFQKIAAIASVHGILVVPHVWGSGIAVATALQCISTLPLCPHTANPVPLQNESVMEFDRNRNELRDDLLLPFAFTLNAEGRVEVPLGPGIGVEVNMEVLDKCVQRLY